MASNVFPTWAGTEYTFGYAVILGYLTVCLLGGSIFTHFMLQRENRQRRAGKRDHLVEGKNDEEILVLGDGV